MPFVPSPLPEPKWTFHTKVVPDKRYEVLALSLPFRSWWIMLPALSYTLRLGLLSHRLGGLVAEAYPSRMASLETWKLTVWEDVPSLARFTNSPLHLAANRALGPWLKGGSVARVSVAGKDLPPSRAALERWLAGGRPLAGGVEMHG